MRRLLYMLLLVASAAHAQPDRLVFPPVPSDPVKKQWADDVRRRVDICKPPCGGVPGATATNTVPVATPTITLTPTITAVPTVLLEKYVTNIADVPAEFLSGYTGICGIMSTNIVDGNPDIVQSCPGPILRFVQFTDDPCICQGAGFASVQVSDTASATGGACIALGENASCSANRCQAIGPGTSCSVSSCTAVGDGASCDDVAGIAIGKGAVANGNSAQAIGGHAGEDAQAFGPNANAGALNSIAFGNFAIVDPVADAAVCIGAGSYCSTSHGLGMGQDASPGGGICFGSKCWSETGDWTFGGIDQKSHPAWISHDISIVTCGTGATIETYSSDVAGAVTVGTGGNVSCVLSFGSAWSQKPSCFVNDETSLVGLRAVASTTQLTFDVLDGVTTIDGDTLRYGCPVSYRGATPTVTSTGTSTATPTITPTATETPTATPT